ncbi:Uncharacterised protein [Mycobacteroides abscessus subsp. abscessus]|nr:Uncharacterised protein [Mycobacteroides abscessus subsp. abscessus]SHQ32271.1 Uncharacterised protein [Mycobacteroides abscessus subsp. abscessus]SHS57543.1 Uncharacterised protein [Mycobacteroides abscessus subsp. abscessus]SHS59256.1 Uncharacterised protein [Mycobacteroides abscessus subsp. abscessus]SHS75842.1 Uncharacterised protein [Mycobacteroides abscessus subsp. abscessus]
MGTAQRVARLVFGRSWQVPNPRPDAVGDIVLDPSLVLRLRGIEWMQRTRSLSVHTAPISMSGTLLDASASRDESTLSEVESTYMGLFRARTRMLGASGWDLPIRACYQNHFNSAGSTRLTIAGETFTATLGSGILAGRRLAAMEWLVHRDMIEISWRGPNFYDQLRAKIFERLPENLAASLLRRCRYLGVSIFDHAQPMLVVGDNGWSTSR